MIPDAHDPAKKHPPMMTTADLSLRFDPIYEPISRRFHKDPAAFADAFARAWFKLTHRDMGPKRPLSRPRSAGRRPDLAGPGAGRRSSADRRRGHRRPQGQDPGLGPFGGELVSTAWASASTFRGSDKRGGANGARIRLAPQKDWEANQPGATGQGAGVLEGIQQAFNAAQRAARKSRWPT
jgi:catalase-peroxidase